MSTDIIFPEKPWQSSLVGSKDKVNALYYNENFSDLTITFPGQDIEYRAHRIIMAVSSSVFEGMLFGPMAIKGSELELPDDNPEAFEIVLSSCYEVNIEPSDIDVALEVYILADKYFMDQLRKEFAEHIGKLLNSENVNKVLEFATHFNFKSLKAKCFQAIETKFQIDVFDASKILLVLQTNWLQELLESDMKTSYLVFQDSWRYPNEILCEDVILKILKNNCRFLGLKTFAGCVSANVISNISWAGNVLEEYNELCISLIDDQQAQEVISVLYEENLPPWLSIHLQCSKIPPDDLMSLPVKQHMYKPDLFISDAEDQGIEWVVSAISALMQKASFFDTINFPSSRLTFSGVKKLLTQLTSICGEHSCGVRICSSEIPSYKEPEIREWRKEHLPLTSFATDTDMLLDRDEDIPGW